MRKLLIPSIAATLLALFATKAGWAQEVDPKASVKKFMQAKLTHSQDLLDGLTNENYEKIIKGAQELSLLSRATQWEVISTPEYVMRSTEFRREVDAMRAAAEKRNLDGATLSFVKITVSCVECHKYVRGIR
jgi:hypothetical protein